MTETILASSLLILIIFFLRRVLAGRVSARLMYALWLIAAVRLLAFPVSLPVSRTSVVRSATLRQTEAALSSPVIPEPSALVRTRQTLTFDDEPVVSAAAPVYAETETPLSAPETHTRRDLLRLIWCAGMLAAGGAVLLPNWRFARRLRRTRTRLELPARCPVYAAEGLPSPCLYGLLRPAIYLPPEMLAEETRLRHVLTHEETHFRHRDHIWALLRAACLIVHWFNPLVWLAAAYSRRDCELACDEGTLARLGEGERFAYGRTLVDVAAGKGRPGDLLRTATMMREGESTLAARVSRIAKKPQTKGAAVLALVTAAALACAGTFTSPEPEIISRELLAQIDAGCESEDPIERYVWRDLRDNGLPRYVEAVEQYEEEPVPVVSVEVSTIPYLHVRAEQYYFGWWKLQPERTLNKETKWELQRYGEGDLLYKGFYLTGTDDDILVTDRDSLFTMRDADSAQSSWINVTLTTSSTDFDEIAWEFMIEAGMRLQQISGENSAGVTWFKVEEVEVFDTLPDSDNSFAFYGTLRCRPVDFNHWTPGDSVAENEDGTVSITRAVGLLRDEYGTWRCVSCGTGGEYAPTEGTDWYRNFDELHPDPLYTNSTDRETIAMEFMEQYCKKRVEIGEKKNLYGLRLCRLEDIEAVYYDNTELEKLGYREQDYPERFLVIATIDSELLSYPSEMEWPVPRQIVGAGKEGSERFRTAAVLYRAEDGGWKGEFVDAYKVQERWIELSGVTTSPDGRFALKLGEATEHTGIGAPLMLTLVDQKTGRVEWEYADRSYAFGVYWSPDSRYAAITHLERHYTETIIVDTADFSDTLVERPDVDLEAVAEDGYRYSSGMLEDLVPLEWLDEKTLKMELSSWMSDKKYVFTYTVE